MDRAILQRRIFDARTILFNQLQTSVGKDLNMIWSRVGAINGSPIIGTNTELATAPLAAAAHQVEVDHDVDLRALWECCHLAIICGIRQYAVS